MRRRGAENLQYPIVGNQMKMQLGNILVRSGVNKQLIVTCGKPKFRNQFFRRAQYIYEKDSIRGRQRC